jgi:broad specificity phosphatase PhoE
VDPVPGIVPLAVGDVVLLRHGETTFNQLGLLNGDPSVSVPLTPAGRAACAALATTLGRVPWAATYVTRFGRTVESLGLIATEPAPTVLADLDDIALGFLESHPRAGYVDWRRTHGVTDAPAGGESRVDALERYARGLGWLAAHAPRPSLAVVHDQPIRYLLNTLLAADPILGPLHGIPNTTPFPVTRPTLADAAVRMRDRAAALRAGAT